MSRIPAPDVTEIKAGLKSLIVDRLSLTIDPASIQDDAPLFGTPDGSAPGSLALDSVEALEIVVGIEEKWGVVIQDDSVSSQFYSIDTLSALVMGLLTDAGEATAVA
jgi:acyl carrier protein